MSGMDVLRERIARALDETVDMPLSSRLACADAVIAALGLVESKAVYALDDTPAPFRRYVTPWERIEEDA